ncbi:hypothetical protein GQ600_19102 [Phytophthora cactorum]|nr:hypothetical protein GQ600_19102 [Phytophthora cactorum]
MVSCSFAAFVVAAATLVLYVDAHSYMIDPMPTWPVSWATNNFAATIAGQTYLPVPDGMSYSTAPELNTEAYWTAFNESSYTSLKDLVDKTAEVETLSPFGTAIGYVEWNQLTEGHDGPCEVWCDDALAFEDDNCAVNYPDTRPSGRTTPPSVYINCVPLTGSLNSTTSTTPISTTTTPQPRRLRPPRPCHTTTTPSTTTADSTAAEAEDSECGSLDVAGPTNRTVGLLTSLDRTRLTTRNRLELQNYSTSTASSVAGESDADEVAGDAEAASYEDSECGSLDMAEDSECGSLDIAESAESDTAYTGSTTGIDFSTLRGANTAGTPRLSTAKVPISSTSSRQGRTSPRCALFQNRRLTSEMKVFAQEMTAQGLKPVRIRNAILRRFNLAPEELRR